MIRESRPEPALNSSLGLNALCQRLQGVATCNILDLGPGRGGNIQFWSRFSPFIYIADLRSSLPLPVLPEDPELRELQKPEWDRILTLPEDGRFDVILAWDMLNYIELPAISSLTRYLSRFCRPEAILFARIFDQKQMPEEIAVYRIADEGHIDYEYGRREMRECPRHQPRALAEAMRPFMTSNAFRLRNGMVEYLFIYAGDETSDALGAHTDLRAR